MQLLEQNESVSYVVTLSPGVVRYLNFEWFLRSDPDEVIKELRTLSSNLEITSPNREIRIYNLSQSSQRDIQHKMETFSLKDFFLDLAELDNLLKNEPWEQKLRIHHNLGRLFLTEAMPSSVYCCFYEFLQLKKHEVSECAKSWIRQAWRNIDVIDSYRKSGEHLVIKHVVRDFEFDYVFQKTLFVGERLDFIAKNASDRKTTEDLDLLRRSKFDYYIYLMEDLRNKKFKIGKSKTPGKRERTLQSEVPQIVMRFSIPAEESGEKELHEHFDAKRIRGEWFELSKTELAWIVSFLKSRGDTSRAFVDFDWLGRIHFDG